MTDPELRAHSVAVNELKAAHNVELQRIRRQVTSELEKLRLCIADGRTDPATVNRLIDRALSRLG